METESLVLHKRCFPVLIAVTISLSVHAIILSMQFRWTHSPILIAYINILVWKSICRFLETVNLFSLISPGNATAELQWICNVLSFPMIVFYHSYFKTIISIYPNNINVLNYFLKFSLQFFANDEVFLCIINNNKLFITNNIHITS